MRKKLIREAENTDDPNGSTVSLCNMQPLLTTSYHRTSPEDPSTLQPCSGATS